MNADEASEALDAVASAKRSLATASAAPLWRHVAFGLVLGLLMLSIAAGDPFWMLPWALSVIGAALLFWWDRRQTGLFVNGYRQGRTLPLTLALLVVTVALAFAAIRLNSHGEQQLALLTVPVAFVVALVVSLWWERIFQREMDARR